MSSSEVSEQTRPWEAMVIIVLGTMYTLYLMSYIPGEVFFSGDAGIKLLMSRQALDGYFGVDLRLPAEPWLQELWDRGAYPMTDPFVYHVGDRYIQAFPVFFAWLSAPFYAIFGWPGLYVLPMAAGIATWARFYILCRQLGASRRVAGVGLLALVLASPLTLYGATFWEHTLAACLTLWGMAELLVALKRGPSPVRLVAGGVLLGLAAYFRPENICFALIVLAIGVPLFWRTQGVPAGRTLGIALGATLALYFAFNLITIGRPLGMHSAQVVDTKPFFHRLTQDIGPLGLNMLWQLVLKFPLAYVGLIGLPFRMLRGWRAGRPVELFLWGVLVAIIAAVPIIAPNTGGICWGPRYIISFIPLFALAATLLLTPREAELAGETPESLLPSRNPVKAAKKSVPPPAPSRVRQWAMPAIFGIGLLWGLGVNLIEGTDWAWAVYQTRVWAAYDYVSKRPERFIAVTDQRTAHEFAPLMPGKSLLLFNKENVIEDTIKTLYDNGQNRFLLVVAGYDPAGLAKARSLPVTSESVGGYRMHLTRPQQYAANYVIYEGIITH